MQCAPQHGFTSRSIGQIRPHLDQASAERLIHASSPPNWIRIHCLLPGLPESAIRKLQKVQNAAARLVLCAPKFCHITPLLIHLHWLPVCQRIKYKVLLYTFKALNNMAPRYLQDLLLERSCSIRSLRSNDQLLLYKPRFSTATFGNRCFKFVAPSLWNSLPVKVRKCE